MAFQRIGIITIIAVYTLILIGGIVRSTGSGMGCPDWPKCFGKWVPPTKFSELPKNYKEIYAEKRREKNARLAKYLKIIGLEDVSKKITEDKSVYTENDFNATKTWIEYINRLLGVLIGFLIILTLFFASSYIKKDLIIFYVSLGAFVLVVFQGWIGSIVVSTNLLPGMITFHSLLATLLVFMLIFGVIRSLASKLNFINIENKRFLNLILIISIIFSAVQVVLGTQVREAIDLIAKELGENYRHTWVSKIGISFYIHRSFSWLVLGTQIYVLYLFRQRKMFQSLILRNCGLSLLGLIVIEILSGICLAYLGMPAVLQPIHLLIANLILGLQFLITLVVNQDKLLINNKLQITPSFSV